MHFDIIFCKYILCTIMWWVIVFIYVTNTVLFIYLFISFVVILFVYAHVSKLNDIVKQRNFGASAVNGVIGHSHIGTTEKFIPDNMNSEMNSNLSVTFLIILSVFRTSIHL
jgi:hypothetical protein